MPDTVAPPAVRGAPVGVILGAGRARRSLLTPGWPFVWFFMGYPLWWLLGVIWIAALAAAVIMLADLYHQERVTVPRHFGWWLLFLAWVAAGVLLVQINAPGAVPGAKATRYLTWGYRSATFCTATVMLVYLCTMRRHLPVDRLTRVLGWMFVYLTVGGILGVLIPYASFPSLLEVLLPHRIADQAFVNSLIHPTLAQVQEYLGVITTRPSGPFPYANAWGLNYICFLPFFVVGWWQHGGRRRRAVAAVTLAASAVPLVLALNRAVWGIVVVSVLFVAVRGALRGRLRLAAACLVVICIGAAVLLATPLGQTVNSRLSGVEHTSDQGRANLSTLTVSSTLQRSAVAGYGTTRDVQGSFQSIAIGSTPSCPTCSGPALGTQGILWFLVFATGLGGAVLFIGFLLLHLLRALRSRAPDALLTSTTLLIYLLAMPFYDLDLTSAVAAFAAVAALTHPPGASRVAGAAGAVRAQGRDGRQYTAMLRRQAIVLMSLTCCGILGGGVWQYLHGTPYIASVSVAIGTDRVVQGAARPMTLDTVAQLATATSPRPGTDHQILPLRISASPNSRLLHLAVSADSPDAAKAAVAAAARALLQQRTRMLTEQQVTVRKQLDARESGLVAGIAAESYGMHVLRASGGAPSLRNALAADRSRRISALSGVVHERTLVDVQPLQVGRIATDVSVVRDAQQWRIALISGGLLGLLLGAIVARLCEVRSPRLRSVVRNRRRHTSLPAILATLRPTAAPDSVVAAARSLRRIPDATCLGVGRDHGTCAAAGALATELRRGGRPARAGQPTVALVVGSRCRVRHVDAAERRLTRDGAAVCGLIVLDEQASQIRKLLDRLRASVHTTTTTDQGVR